VLVTRISTIGRAQESKKMMSIKRSIAEGSVGRETGQENVTGPH
jgi:hypothetical protein